MKQKAETKAKNIKLNKTERGLFEKITKQVNPRMANYLKNKRSKHAHHMISDM